MEILKSGNEYTENAVAVSRIHQEALEISRNNSVYGVIADLIGCNIEGIDRLAVTESIVHYCSDTVRYIN